MLKAEEEPVEVGVCRALYIGFLSALPRQAFTRQTGLYMQDPYVYMSIDMYRPPGRQYGQVYSKQSVGRLVGRSVG